MMIANSLWTLGLVPGALVAALAMQPMEAAATGPHTALQVLDLAGEQRLLIAMGPLGTSAASTVAAALDTVASGGRNPRAAILHRFSVELLDSAGRRVPDEALQWATVLTGAATDPQRPRLRSLVRLSAGAAEVSLPKPLGYRLDAGDSLLVLAVVTRPQAGTQLYLRITIEYEALDRPVSRLAVLPLHAASARSAAAADPPGAESATWRSWEWTPEVCGRMLALAGEALESARELVLEDLTSGEVLWRMTVAGQDARAGYGRPGPVVRLGVAIEQGRHYRLTATYGGLPGGLAAADADDLHAMLLPARSAAPDIAGRPAG